MVQIEKETIEGMGQINYYLIINGIKMPISQLDFLAKEKFLNTNIADIDLIDVDNNNNLIIKTRI